MHTIAMITGATSGIGKDTALLLAKNGFRVIITGRRDDLLKEVTESIGATDPDRVFPLCFDVRDRESVKKAFDTLPENWKRISVLINNAGLASGFEPIHEGDFADWDKMIDTNIKGILNVTYFVSKIMVENRSGHIVNVSSVGGKETYPNGNVY
ncbi:MAG TPA: SDR family NAD(P)-dependent oxidoreductase, partial [Prolixibacteraceae bacterium]|nr:SDR family NAD(P)-dependent oxidoreductase [Prolixibacteraceae bacterium]